MENIQKRKNTKGKDWTEFFTDLTPNVGKAERIGSSVAGGALIAYGVRRGGALGTLLSIAGGGLALRGVTGHCQAYDAAGIDTTEKSNKSDSKNFKSPRGKGWFAGKIHVTKSVTINKSPAELYQFWRNFENLPQFMKHLESVTTTGEKTSHWKAKAPLGSTVEWDAEVTSDVENEKIGWKSAEISQVPNSGVVQFLPTSDRGTEVKVTLTYEPPAGEIGALVAKLFGEEPSQQIAEDLRRFKSLMETGLIMNVKGQPSGRAEKARGAKA